MHPASTVFSRSVTENFCLQIAHRSGRHTVFLIWIVEVVKATEGSRVATRAGTRLSDIHGQRHRHDQNRKRVRQGQRRARRSRPECCKCTAESNAHQQKYLQKNHLDSNQTLAENHKHTFNILRKTLRNTIYIENRQLHKNQQNPVDSCRKQAKSSEHPQNV